MCIFIILFAEVVRALREPPSPGTEMRLAKTNKPIHFLVALIKAMFIIILCLLYTPLKKAHHHPRCSVASSVPNGFLRFQIHYFIRAVRKIVQKAVCEFDVFEADDNKVGNSVC